MKTASSLELLEPRVAPAGIIQVFASGGVLKLIGDAAQNALGISAQNDGTVKLTPLSGTELRFEGNTTTSALTIPVAAPKLVADLGNSDDQIFLTGPFSGVVANLGDGSDYLVFGNTEIAGNTKINAGPGNDVVEGSNSTVQRFFGNVTLAMGAGQDTAQWDSAQTHITGSLIFIGGRGSDSPEDTFTMSSFTTIGGNLSVRFGSVEGTFTADADRFTVLGRTSISATTGTAGTVTCAFAADMLYLHGGVYFFPGDGTGVLSLIGSERADILSDVQARGAKSLLSVFITSPALSIGGDVSAKGPGETRLTIGANLYSVAGDIAAYGGEILTFTLAGEGGIQGNLSMAGKSGGILNVSGNGNTRVGGNATINFQSSALASEINLTRLTVSGVLSILGGSSIDIIRFHFGVVAGKFTISTGAGNDSISLESNGAELLGLTTVSGRMLVNAGRGDDSVSIGNSGTSQSLVAYSPVVLIGGSGSDTQNFAGNPNLLFSGSSVSGFEIGT